MKKHYLKLKVKIITLVVIVLLLGCGVLTYHKADQIRSDYLREINDNSGLATTLRMNGAESCDDFIQQVYYEYGNIHRFSDDVGFFSMLKDKNGNTLAEDQNFLIVHKGGDEHDRRIVLMGDDFITDNEGSYVGFAIGAVSKMEITGICDDTYMYLDELKWENLSGESCSYVPKEKNKAPKATVKFEEWAGDKCYDERYDEGFGDNKFYVSANITCATYGDEIKNKKINTEAEKICNQIYEDYASGVSTQDLQMDEGIFTCYVANTGYLSDEYAVPSVFVFHPVSIAINELKVVFFVVFVFAIICIIFICSIINTLYGQQLAYEMNRRKLTRGIAHELKTPLAITKGYVENWEYLDEKDRPEYSRVMIDEIEHMNKMVTDLLELSRLEAKAKEVNFESVDVYALTKSVLRRMKGTIEERGLVVKMSPGYLSGHVKNAAVNSDDTDDDNSFDGKFLVMADLEMMRTVLVNFISNAMKYADKEINITLLEKGRKIKFEITNDGETIEADKANKVWDEFYRTDRVNNSCIGSSGLGLAITKNILILHGAEYGCKSQKGNTSFWFEMKKDDEVL